MATPTQRYFQLIDEMYSEPPGTFEKIVQDEKKIDLQFL
jgi:hypothetical protein